MKLRCLAVIALLTALVTPFLATPAMAAGNDYPYRLDTTQSADPWGFTKRQCVSFAAWRLAQRHHALSNKANAWGSAYHWDEAARARGIRITATPKVGAIAQWNSRERSTYYASNGATGYFAAGAYGHVAVVVRVYGDRSVVVEQYNMFGNRSYSTMHVRAPRYLYLAG